MAAAMRKRESEVMTIMMLTLATVSTISRTEERLKQVKPICVIVKDDASVEKIIQALNDICVDDIDVIKSLFHQRDQKIPRYYHCPRKSRTSRKLDHFYKRTRISRASFIRV